MSAKSGSWVTAKGESNLCDELVESHGFTLRGSQEASKLLDEDPSLACGVVAKEFASSYAQYYWYTAQRDILYAAIIETVYTIGPLTTLRAVVTMRYCNDTKYHDVIAKIPVYDSKSR